MSLSCTISQILLIISQNLMRSHDCDHTHLRDYLSIWRLIFHMANQCTKFQVSSISRSRDILGDKKFKMGQKMWPHPFHLSSIGWDLLWSTCTSNLKSLCSPTMKMWKANHNVETGVVWGVRCHQGHRSPVSWVTPAMSPYDRVHMTSYTTLIEAMNISCTVFEL